MTAAGKIAGLFVGKVATLGQIASAINKQAVAETLYLSKLGLAGDECADNRHHGGLERALHQYPAEHYEHWQAQYPNAKRDWLAPGMGENISSYGMTEANVYIGDQYQLGEAIIELSQPRSPCFKLNEQWGLADFAEAMQQQSRCGWLYRVLQPGDVSFDNDLVLISREKHALSVQQVCDYFFNQPLNRDGLEALLAQEKLSDNWKAHIIKRLQNNQVENWHFRLFGTK